MHTTVASTNTVVCILCRIKCSTIDVYIFYMHTTSRTTTLLVLLVEYAYN